MRYVTMTPSGSHGNSYEAPEGTAGAEQAAQLAEADGYEVLDVMGEVLVIAE